MLLSTNCLCGLRAGSSSDERGPEKHCRDQRHPGWREAVSFAWSRIGEAERDAPVRTRVHSGRALEGLVLGGDWTGGVYDVEIPGQARNEMFPFAINNLQPTQPTIATFLALP